MSNIDGKEATADILAHFGTKGMKWGIRKSPEKAAAKEAKKIEKADVKWAQKSFSTGTMMKVNNSYASKMNGGETDKFYNKPEWKDKDFTGKDKHLDDAHIAAYEKHARPSFQAALDQHVGTSPSGKYKAEAVNALEQSWQMVEVGSAKHDAFSEIHKMPSLKLIRDSKGVIIRVEPPKLTHSEEAIAEVLTHYGTKGMKWGVRKSDIHPSVSVSTGTSRTGKAKIKTSGGKGESVSKDAAEARVIKQTYKKSGTNALSNDELRALTTRLQLEKQVSEAASPAGKKMVKNFLFRNGRQTVDRSYQEGITNRVAGAIKDAATPKVAAPPTLFD